MKEIKNLVKAARRIKKAVKNKEKIILYGDADLDGTCSVVILEESINNLGGDITKAYFPEREKEGYGMNKKALNHLKPLAPALLISLDCGIGNVKETEIAKKMGFEVIIIDHHKVLDEVPKASIIVDPKQEGDDYPFKEFANTGIVYKLAKVLLEDKLKGFLNKSFLELTALATMADMMPQIDENRVFITEGINSLNKTTRPGLEAFWGVKLIDKNLDRNKSIAIRMLPVLNAAGVENHLTRSYLLLTATDSDVAEGLVEELIDRREEKISRVEEITWKVKERALENPSQSIIFEGDENWPLAFAGAVASKICNEFKEPVFIFRKGKTKSRGAVRVPKGLDSVEAMRSCSDLLDVFGGHPLASGFTIKNKNLDEFKKGLINYFIDKL